MDLDKLYKLQYNPFFSERHDFPPVGRKIIFKGLQKTIFSFLDSRSSGIFIIRGEYGYGKSFTLLNLEHRIKEEDFLQNRNVFCVSFRASPPRPPTNYLLYLYTEAVKKLGPKTFQQLRDKLGNMAKESKSSSSDLLRQRNIHDDFINALKNFDDSLAWSWFIGQKLRNQQLNDIEIKQNIVDDSSAWQALLSFLRLIDLLDYKGLIFLIDEFEYLFSLGGGTVARYLTAYKDLYDDINKEISLHANVAPIIFVIACSDATWGYFKDLVKSERMTKGGGGFAPFMDRIKEEYLLTDLSEAQIGEIVATRLAKARLKQVKVPHNFFPFESDCRREFYLQSGGVPRAVIENCRIVIEDCLSQKICPISPEDFKNVLRKRGRLTDFEEMRRR